MEYFGIENKGSFIHEILSTLSAWVPTDEGRQVYANDVKKYYVGTNSAWLVVGGGGSANDVSQIGHSFLLGDVLRYDSGTSLYVKAKADTTDNAEVIGIVSNVLNANSFTLLNCGYVTGLAGLVAGSTYFLSDATAGLLTLTEPITEDHVSKPLLIAESATTGYFFNMRGAIVGGGSTTYTKTFDDSDLSSGILTVVHNFGHQYTSIPAIIDNTGKIVLPDEITYTNTTQLSVDLSSYGTITGTWRAVVQDSGASLAQDYVSDSAFGSAWNDVTDVAPSKNAVYDEMTKMQPVGGELLWPTETAPTGWLEENGASLVRADYAALFAVIGTMYGTADETHFNLPDSRGKFPRIWAHGQATDPDRATRTAPTATGATLSAGDHVGTEQAEELKAHVHTLDLSSNAGGSDNAYRGATTVASPNTGSTGGNETRPINTYRMMIIKAY